MLTANGARLVGDSRIKSMVSGSPQERIVKLRVRDIAPQDSGVYTCQVPTVPPVSLDVYIRVIPGV